MYKCYATARLPSLTHYNLLQLLITICTTQVYELGATLANYELRNDAWQWIFKNDATFLKVASAQYKTRDS